jgi:hypothetical protein
MAILKNNRGSFTVEAAIIFSIAFLIFILLIYTSIIMYQYAFAQSIADEAAGKGSIYWPSDVNKNIYWRLYDGNSREKCILITKYIQDKLAKSILKTESEVKVYTQNMLLQKNLKIEIYQSFPLPLGNLFSIFGMKPKLVIRAQSISPINDNPEFIRNMDMIIDIKNCLLNSDNKWIGEGTKANEIIDKLIKNNNQGVQDIEK